ncbi:MAG: N-acetylneuraminate lyase, partial [Clostridiales bacterium]|nr:N-acetylneuraminate lyase [Clostridiales bacterium]
MKDELKKYCGIIPAFYACYDEDGNVSRERTKALARHLVNKGVKGLYVGGSSGECIYLEKEERMAILEAVMEEVKGECTIIAHVACNNTRESCQLAAHAESLGVDAVASIPPIYFHLPEHAIAKYWNTISAAAPNTDFIIYNIPQLAGVALSVNLFNEMRRNPRVIGVKNSSMPVQDIQMFKAAGGEDSIVFNGPDEQYVGGRAIGADGGIGGTYGVMPELYLKMDELIRQGKYEEARAVQYAADEIIYAMCACRGNLYAVMKKIMELREGLKLGSVRAPLPEICEGDMPQIEKCAGMITDAIRRFC